MKAAYFGSRTRLFRHFLAVSFLVALVAGCGDDSGDPGTTSQAPSGGSSGGGSSGGSTLSMSGTPPSQVLIGQAYSFTPTVNNPGGAALTFTASNLPAWATINASTGQISGTPGAGDVGTYSNIRITVSGGGSTVTSPAYSVQVVGSATGTATLTWTPPTENTDGSALQDLSGYKVYWGQSPSNLNNSATINNVGITTYVVDQLTPATWYFATTALNASGLESAFSNIASKTVN